MLGDHAGSLAETGRIGGGPRREAVHVSVEHAEGGGDEFPLASTEGVGGLQEHVRQRGHWPRHLGPEGKEGPDTWQTCGDLDVSHAGDCTGCIRGSQ